MHAPDTTHLQLLSESPYELTGGQPLTGLTLYNGQQEAFGCVNDLLIDTDALRMRYLVARLYEDVGDTASTQVLIPIGMAELRASQQEVVIPGLTSDVAGRFSPYPYDALKNNVQRGQTVPNPALADAGSYDPFSDEHFYRHHSGKKIQLVRRPM